MFFEIKNTADHTFTETNELSNGLWLNRDSGWQKFILAEATVYIKGYVEDRAIDQEFVENISDDTTPRYQGNYLAIVSHNTGIIDITHDVHRSTPLAISTDPLLITNLLNNDLTKIWADRTVSISQGKITEHFFDPYGDIDVNIKTRSQVVGELHHAINTKFEKFFSHNQQKIKVFLSGGIDTLTLFSYLKKFTSNFEICNYEHVDFTKFYCNKRHLIDQYWGYKQIHLWKDPSILLTGANGDENLMRSPATVTLLMMHYGLELLDIIKPEHYHCLYLTADKLIPTYQSQKIQYVDICKDYSKVIKQILNINLHDHQHWHYDNTLTLTPFKDLELCKLMLSLPKDDLIDQVLNAGISKELITLNDSELLDSLSIQKNYNSQENLYKIYSKYC
jgi:hypothetical protein